FRLIATSNRDMQEEVRKGTFREDLYFRLNVMSLELPPLRERPGDIAALADHFIKKYAEANAIKISSVSPEVYTILLAHEWRGNVRELENTMHRAVLLSQSDVLTRDAILLTGGRGVPVSAIQPNAEAVAFSGAAVAGTKATAGGSASAAASGLVGKTVAAVERDLIIDTLQHCLGNRTHAANILGISIRTLRNKLKQYNEEGISVPPAGEGDQAVL
ncbi:MAG TPA: helix-turn-helix domain-containing protein, partial [Dongiaceae bacterium]